MIESCALVTGGNGYIGRHLIQRIVAEGGRVVALVRSGRVVTIEPHDSVVVRPMHDFSRKSIHAAASGRRVDAIYHLAAHGVRPTDRDIDTMIEVNARLPAAVAQVACDLGAPLIHVGSSAEYAAAANDETLKEDAPLETGRLYGSTKAAGGLLAAAVASARGGMARVMRLFQVYGPGEDTHRLLSSLVGGLVCGCHVPLSAGEQVRDFVHVDDVVDALLAAREECGKAGAKPTEYLNVCTGIGSSVRDFAGLVADTLGASPDLLGFGELPYRADDERRRVGNPARMCSVTGWRARIGLREGIARALEADRSIVGHPRSV